jgi:hypothetical protein
MDYILSIKIPIDAKDDEDARRKSISYLKWLSATDGTVGLYDVTNNSNRKVAIKNEIKS